MIDPRVALTILAMASVTYLTRIGGYVLLRNRTLSNRAMAVMEAAPGCVLISVIAPDFVSDKPANLIALAVTVLPLRAFHAADRTDRHGGGQYLPLSHRLN